jgi:hypothetical protein
MRLSAVRTLRWSGLVAVVCLAPPAFAQSAPITDEARQHFSAGVAYLQDPDGARYAEAYQEFAAAYKVSPSWKILGNLGISAMKLERDGEAIQAYTKYLQEGGAELDPSEKEQIARDLNTLKASLATLTLESTPAGVTIIDERVPVTGSPVVNRYGPLDGPTPLGVKGGHHRFTAQLDGYDAQHWEVDAQPGTNQPHSFALKTSPPPAAPSSGVSANNTAMAADHVVSTPLRIASYAALGIGVVGLAGGTIFALSAKSKANEATDLCGGSLAACALDDGSDDAIKVTKLNSDSGSAKTLGIVGFAVGGVGIAAGITLFVLSSSKSSHADSAKLGPSITPWVGYNSAGVTGQF